MSGLSGAFGTLSVGQIWSASDNHAGSILDNTQYYGDDKLTGRVGGALSYAFSSGPVSLQADALFDDGMDNDPNEDIQEFQFGLSVQMGEIGKIALSYIDDKYSLDSGTDGLVGIKRMLGQTGTVNSNAVVIPTSASNPTPLVLTPDAFSASTVNGDITVLDSLLIDDNMINEDDLDESDEVEINRYKIGNVIVERSVTKAKATSDDTDTTMTDESQATNAYKFYDADTGAVLDLSDDGDDDTTWNTKTTALAAQVSIANISIYAGVAKEKAKYDGHPHAGKEMTTAQKAQAKDKETDTTFFGLNGGLGDTGVNFHFHWRDEDKSKPWVLGLTKSLGDSALLVLEHSNNDGASPNATNLGLHVNF